MRRPQHFVGVAVDAGPVHVADTIDDFSGTRSAAHQVAAVNNEVGPSHAQIGNDRVECTQVGVNV